MLKRILTAIVALCVFVPVVIFHATPVFPIFFALCALIGTYEMLKCIGIHKNAWVAAPMYLLALLCPLATRQILQYLSEEVSSVAVAALGVILLATLYFLAVVVFGHKTLDSTSMGTAIMMALYIVGGFSCMVYLHDTEGLYVCLLVFIGAWFSDTFAYFTGRLLGKHKLIPEVSPKKTVEGAIGGVVFSAGAFVLYELILRRFFTSSSIPLIAMAGLGVLVAVVSMVGDLVLSQIKRHYGIKDYGNLLPGHGGVLDRFDSTLAVAILLAVVFSISNGWFSACA